MVIQPFLILFALPLLSQKLASISGSESCHSLYNSIKTSVLFVVSHLQGFDFLYGLHVLTLHTGEFHVFGLLCLFQLTL